MPPEALDLIAAALEDKRPLRLVNKLLCDTVDSKVRRARARTFSASFKTLARAPWNLRELDLDETDTGDAGLTLLTLGRWKDLDTLALHLAPDRGCTPQRVRDAFASWPKLHTLRLACSGFIRKDVLAAIADAAPRLASLAMEDVSRARTVG